jgi:hypothetical protein
MKALVSNIIGEEYPIVKGSVVDINNYKDYYKHLECSTFDVVRVEWLGEEISIFVDDEGMLKSNNFGRMVKGCPQPLFGNMVICGGVDRNGDTIGIPENINLLNLNEFIGEIEYQIGGA